MLKFFFMRSWVGFDMEPKKGKIKNKKKKRKAKKRKKEK